MKPSIYRQIKAVPVVGREMKDSPRCWNNGLLRHKGKLWMCYRFHLKEASGRCATAIVELDPVSFQPRGTSQHLALSGPTGSEHHEDARLFMFKGEPHLSYTEMRGYRPGVDYTCVIRYAKLKLRGNRWQIVEVFQPRYASNDGRGKEKNWVFFETDGKLYAVYSTGPQHVVIELEGERVKNTYSSPGAAWSWGHLRGGTPPILQNDGTFLSIFHSSLPGEEPPHFVRYYAGAYTFESKPPFAPIRISTRPIMAGSEEDGHKVDPRYVAGWKPYVVFPCGLVVDDSRLLVSFGVNDWQCALGTLTIDQLYLASSDGSELEPRYFRSENGSVPVRIMDVEQRPKFMDWTVPRASCTGAAPGFMSCDDPREAQEVAELPGVSEISREEYEGEIRTRAAAQFRW